MNTPQSQLLGWGSLIAAAGVSYYYARQSINERRKAQDLTGARPSEKLDWRARIAQQEQNAGASEGPGSTPAVGQAGSTTAVGRADSSKSGGSSAPK